MGWLTWNIFTDYNKSLLAKLMFLWYYPYTKQLYSHISLQALSVLLSFSVCTPFWKFSCCCRVISGSWFCVVHKVFDVRTSNVNTTWKKDQCVMPLYYVWKIKASLAFDFYHLIVTIFRKSKILISTNCIRKERYEGYVLGIWLLFIPFLL